MDRSMGGREWLLLAALSILWGGGFVFIGIAVADVPPFTLVLGRVTLASVALVGYVYVRGGRMPTAPRLWRAFLVMGALNGVVPYTLIVWGQIHVASGVAAVLNSTTPLFSVLLGHVFTEDERITPARFAGVVIGLAGVLLLTAPQAIHRVGVYELGQLAVLAAAFSYACAGIYGRRFADLPPAVAAAGQVLGTVVLVLPLSLIVERPWTVRPAGATVAAIVALGLLSTALAYLLFFRILAAAGATNAMLVTFLVPVTALLLGSIVLRERPAWNVFAGLALIVAGIVAVGGRPSSWLAALRRRAQRRRASAHCQRRSWPRRVVDGDRPAAS